MAKPNIYLHIGTIKTGTTSLQNFFHLNRATLQQTHRIYYPSTPGLKNHTNLPIYAGYKNIRDIKQRKKLLDADNLKAFQQSFKEKFLKEITPQIRKGNHILLSNEHLSGRVQEVAEIERLLDLFKGFEAQFKVIIYLRRQDKMMLSTYSTWVKNGGKWRVNPTAYTNKRYDYVALLDMWASQVGKENMIVRPFEKSRFKNGDLYADFCQLLQIPTISDWQIPEQATQLNASLDQEQLQFLSAFNKYVPVMVEDKKNDLRGNIVQYLEESASRTKIDLSYEEKVKIGDYFKKDNAQIVRTYMADQEVPLFDPIPQEEPEEQTATTLTKERAIQIAAYLWMQQQQEINRYAWWEKWRRRLKIFS